MRLDEIIYAVYFINPEELCKYEPGLLNSFESQRVIKIGK